MTVNSSIQIVVLPIFVAMAFYGSTSAIGEDSPTVGIEKRVPWTTSKISGSPDPALPYITERVFPALKFNQSLDLTSAPGSDRLFVVEQSGKIFSFVNHPDVKSADLVVDLAKEIPGVQYAYALTFHPDFLQNRYCYVCYIKAPELPDGTHVARFRVTDANPPTIDVSSETTILTWLSGGHNGCSLKFGPDRCLYISTGDGGPANPPDILRTGQDLGDLLSSILRIDVDHAENGLSYRVPSDNPFVDLKGARGEIWAYGLRNPWRISFDRKTGDLWVGDVGWELWELLDRIERGGNYGWSVLEGRQSTNPEWARGPTPILPPTIEHSHTESSSITEGLTYYGTRLKELYGKHIYSDYDTGKFWSFFYLNGQVIDHQEIADTTHRIVGFGEDHDGEFYVLDHLAGTIHRLIPNPNQNQSSTFPRKLSESGMFSSLNPQKPASGVIAYSLNAEPWADHAVSERYVAIPGEQSIKVDEPKWTFPKDSVLVKTLSLEMMQGDPGTRRQIETQILHFDGIEWKPYTYQWNDAQTDATLVDAVGAERTIDIADPGAAGGIRRQTWRFAGRAECQRCHNSWSGPPLAFHTPQLNKNARYGDITASQLNTFAHIHLFEKPISLESAPRLVEPSDVTASLESRARAYLQVNCAHCHRKHAGGAVLSQMHYDVPLDQTMMLGVRPTQGTFGIHSAQVIAPSDPFRSVLLYRMSKLGGGRMPYIGSTEVDQKGTQLIADWIRQMPFDSAKDKIGSDVAAVLRREEVADFERLQSIEEARGQAIIIDRLLASTSGAMMLLRAVDQRELPASALAMTIEKATSHTDVSVRDLYERFLPKDQRIKRLGTLIHPKQILSLTGDLSRGKQIFFETAGVSCKNCHQIEKEGKEVGPELTKIGNKLTRAQLLESMLEPSKLIDPKYVTYLVETVDGRLITGLLVSKDDHEVVLKDVQANLIRISAKSIEHLVPQRQSLMPELQLRDLTAQQVADLLEFLGSLK